MLWASEAPPNGPICHQQIYTQAPTSEDLQKYKHRIAHLQSRPTVLRQMCVTRQPMLRQLLPDGVFFFFFY